MTQAALSLQSSHSRSSTSSRNSNQRFFPVMSSSRSRQILDITFGHIKEVKAYWTQAFVDSRCSLRRHHLTWKGGNTSQSIRCGYEVRSSCRSRSASPKKLNLFKDPALSQVFGRGFIVEKVKKQSSQRRKMSIKGNANFNAITYFQEYVNKLPVNTTVSALFKVRFVCSISIHLKIRERFFLRLSGMLQLDSGEHSHRLCVEGACCQSQEILVTQAFKMKTIYSFEDWDRMSQGIAKLVVHTAHGVLLSDRREDDQQVKASCSRLCQCHSGQDSRCSECALRSKEKSWTS